MSMKKVLKALGYIGTIILLCLQLLLLSFVIVSAVGGILFFCLCAFAPVKAVWLCMHYVLISGTATAILEIIFTTYVFSRATLWSKAKPGK